MCHFYFELGHSLTEWFSDIALSTFEWLLASKQQIIFGHISDIGNMFSNINDH